MKIFKILALIVMPFLVHGQLTDVVPPLVKVGTIVHPGVYDISHGGTGATTRSAAINNLLPTQLGNANRFLMTNGIDVVWNLSASLPLSTGGTNTSSTPISIGTSQSFQLLTGTSQTINLPIGAVDGREIIIVNHGTNYATISPSVAVQNGIVISQIPNCSSCMLPGMTGNVLKVVWVSAVGYWVKSN